MRPRLEYIEINTILFQREAASFPLKRRASLFSHQERLLYDIGIYLFFYAVIT